MDRNLGALQAATSSTDANAYGDLYQWGRGSDGHQCRNSPTTTTLSSTDQPGHGNFIVVAPNLPYDWCSPQNNSLWQGVNGINNPCPTGYRLPTNMELNAELGSWNISNAAGAFSSPLKLTLAGRRFIHDGSVGNVGSGSEYWSSTVSATNSTILAVYDSFAVFTDTSRGQGYSVRCIKD